MIKIKRHSGYVNKLASYKVICDKKIIGEIKDNQETTFEIPNGTHQIYLKINWCRSNKIVFNTNDNDIYFECGSLTGFKIFLAIFYMTFFYDKYLWLKEIK